MPNITNPLQKIRIVYRRSSPVVKIVAAVAIVLSMLAITAMGWARGRVLKNTEQLRKEAFSLEQSNSSLSTKIALLGSVQGVKLIAQEDLGMVDPGTVIIDVD